MKVRDFYYKPNIVILFPQSIFKNPKKHNKIRITSIKVIWVSIDFCRKILYTVRMKQNNTIKLIKGSTLIQVKVKVSGIKGFNYTYTLQEHRRKYICNTTPQVVKMLGRLELRGYQEMGVK